MQSRAKNPSGNKAMQSAKTPNPFSRISTKHPGRAEANRSTTQAKALIASTGTLTGPTQVKEKLKPSCKRKSITSHNTSQTKEGSTPERPTDELSR